jgi:hypothetical protein
MCLSCRMHCGRGSSAPSFSVRERLCVVPPHAGSAVHFRPCGHDFSLTVAGCQEKGSTHGVDQQK